MQLKSFVLALVALSLLACTPDTRAATMKFRVGKGGISQNYAPNCPGGSPSPAYVKVTWPDIMFDTTGGFSSDRFTAQQAGTLIIGWNVWNQAGVTNSQGGGITAKAYFNATHTFDAAAIGTVGEYANTSSMASTMVFDMAQGDYVEIWNYAWPESCSTNVVVDGNNAHTYWWGVFIPAGQ